MPYPLEDPAISQYVREVLEVTRHAITLNAPLNPGMVVSGTTSPNSNGEFLLQNTLINGRVWFATATHQLKANSEGFYTLGPNVLGSNYWISDKPYANPYQIEGWVAIGAPTGTPVLKKVYGLTVDAEPGRQAVYQSDRWFKLSTAGWQRLTEESQLLNIGVSSDESPKEQGEGFMVSGNIPQFAQGLIINAGLGSLSPDTDGRDAFTNTGIIEGFVDLSKALYFSSLFGNWRYTAIIDGVSYEWKYEGTDANTDDIASWTWEVVGNWTTEIPVFTPYNEIGTVSKLGSTFIVPNNNGEPDIYLCTGINPYRYRLIPTEYHTEELIRASISNVFINNEDGTLSIITSSSSFLVPLLNEEGEWPVSGIKPRVVAEAQWATDVPALNEFVWAGDTGCSAKGDGESTLQELEWSGIYMMTINNAFVDGDTEVIIPYKVEIHANITQDISTTEDKILSFLGSKRVFVKCSIEQTNNVKVAISAFSYSPDGTELGGAAILNNENHAVLFELAPIPSRSTAYALISIVDSWEAGA